MGLPPEELTEFKKQLSEKGIECEYYRLDDILTDKDNSEPAALIIIRNGVEKLINESASNMLSEQLKFEWDKKILGY